MSNIFPERTCIVCRKKSGKEDFVKLVKNKSGEILIEKDKKLDGRGAYICRTESCINGAKKSKAINKVFRTAVPEQIYEELANELKK